MIHALLAQGLGRKSPEQKGDRVLHDSTGRQIDAYVFVRSYQEMEKKKYKSVAKALDESDRQWKERELIVFPSHVHRSAADIDEMIAAAHGTGFDIICALVVLESADRQRSSPILRKRWDERVTIINPRQDDEQHRRAQLNALGCDLWTWICKALTT
jgi:hypothetical protein